MGRKQVIKVDNVEKPTIFICPDCKEKKPIDELFLGCCLSCRMQRAEGVYGNEAEFNEEMSHH